MVNDNPNMADESKPSVQLISKNNNGNIDGFYSFSCSVWW